MERDLELVEWLTKRRRNKARYSKGRKEIRNQGRIEIWETKINRQIAFITSRWINPTNEVKLIISEKLTTKDLNCIGLMPREIW